MTLLHSHSFCRAPTREPRFDHVAALWPHMVRRLKRVARAARRGAGALLRASHLAIIAGKLRHERMMHDDVAEPKASQPSDDHRHQPNCTANVPQRPLILDDKWDF